MSEFSNLVPTAIKTSTPDWMFDGSCECLLPMCPTCDADFYIDQMRDDFCIWDDDVPAPF